MRIGFSGTGTVAGHRPEYEIPPEPDMIGKDTAELACRQGAGIEVTLLWHRTSGELIVTVSDVASGAAFELPVAADEALTTFHHPYAYAADQGGGLLGWQQPLSRLTAICLQGDSRRHRSRICAQNVQICARRDFYRVGRTSAHNEAAR